jgi:hypothetical protein
MGAWDIGVFGNDEAADWSFELQEAEDFEEFLADTFSLGEDEEYLEAPDGSSIVAAAAVVAASAGTIVKGFPADLKAWLEGKEAALRGMSSVALAALKRVRAENSELKDLWEETEEFATWGETLDRVAAGLVKPS